MDPQDLKDSLKDEAAKERLFEELRPRLYKTAVHFLGYQDPEAEDVVQESLLIVFSKFADFDPAKGSLYNWASHICVKVCLRRFSRRRRWVLSVEEDFEALLASRAAQAHEKGREEQAQAEREQRLGRHMDSMGEPCSGLLRLRGSEGRSYAEIGQRLKLPLGTVMSRLARCKESLKRLLLADADFRFVS